MKVIVNKYIPFGGFKAILFAVWLFCHRYPGDIDYNHEDIHCHQGIEMLFVFFWLWYGIEWLVRFLTNGFKAHEAYRSVSFEKEAYANEQDMTYLKNREPYSWVMYL